ncbi:MAG: prepilin-type N-terminal cleavage/methylation domain-containing protein [Candidatus Uhrbacteria bacterium]
MKYFSGNKKGQSLIEVVIAMAIFAVIAGAFMSISLGSFTGLVQGGEKTEAQALAEEGMEAIRSVRDGAWNELVYSPVQVLVIAGTWEISSSASELINNKYTRIITVSDVCRDGTDIVATCPASYIDPYLKFVVVTVSWESRPGSINTAEQSGFISNWDSRDWTQTDWSGGSGQTTWSNETRHDSDDGGVYAGTAGQVTLAQDSDGTWALSGGEETSDTSDTNFNAGTYTNTAISGSGSSASVVLSQAPTWSLHTDTGSESRNDITCTSVTNCWAVGNSGALARYNGTTWTTSTIPSSANINAIYALSANDIWVAGASGRFWHYNGSVWSLHTDTGNQTWSDLVCTSATSCWAVGNSGALARYNGTTWTTSTIPSSAQINAIFALSSSNIWAVGASGRIWRYNGTAWSLNTSTGSEIWNDITCPSATNCWAVGNSGALVQYNGISWTKSVIPSSAHINSVYAVSASNIWAAGASGYLWNYNGTAWSLNTDTGNEAWNSIFMNSSSSGWVVDTGGQFFRYGSGYQPSGTFQSRIFDSGLITTTWNIVSWTETVPAGGDITVAVRYGNTATPDGTWSAWSGELVDPLGSTIAYTGRYFQYRLTLTRPTVVTSTVELADITISYNTPTNKHLNAVDMVSSGDGWIVGNGGVILRYNGTNWSVVTSPVGDDLFDITMISASDGWIVGAGGKILHYDGSNWSEFFDTGNEQWNAVDMLSAGDGWAVGNGGEIAHWDGSIWDDSVVSPTGHALNDVVVVDSAHIWAGGADNFSEIIFYTDGVWVTHTDLPGNEAVQSLFFSLVTDGWAISDSGQFMRFDGTSWNDWQDTGVDAWRDGICVSTNDCWAVGDNGLIARWNGAATWDPAVPSPTPRQLNGIDMVSASDGWAVGNNGTIIHYSRGDAFLKSGSFVSSAFNMNNVSPVQIVEWDEIKPANTDIQLQIRTAPDSGGVPGAWTDWYGSSGAGTYFTSARGALVPLFLNGNQWVQYRVELSGDGTSTPTLQGVRINYK